MHKNLIKTKYKNFLESNFYFSSDQNKACEILSNVSNENIAFICEKSSKILENFSSSSNRIEALKIFAHSNTDKIYSLVACEEIFDEFSWDSEKINFLEKLDKIDAAKTYAVSLAKDHLKDFSWKSEKIKFLDDIISAKTIEEAFDLVGVNDYGSNLPFHEIYYGDSSYYNGNSSYYNGNSYNYETTYSSSSNQKPIYPIVQKESPVIHNHYYVNENQTNQNSQIVTEEETSALGTLEWLALAATGVAAWFGFNYLTSDSEDNNINQSSNSYVNNTNDFFKTTTQPSVSLFPLLDEIDLNDLPPAYSFEDLYPRVVIKPSAPSIDDDLPPSYESLFPGV